MKKLLLSITITISVVLSAVSQSITISGIVTVDNEDAIGATLNTNTDQHAITEIDGSYRLEVNAGIIEIATEYIGSEPQIIRCIVSRDTTINFSLSSASNLIDAVTVTAKSEAAEKQTAAIAIESIEMAALQNTVRDLDDAVDQLSGVRVRTSGALGSKADISLNGLNGTAVRTYIDGLPMEFLYPNSSLGNLPMNNVKRIDVYKGVVPVEVGTDALGGGINVIPNYKTINSFSASYALGSFNTHQAGLNASKTLAEGVALFTNIAHIQSDNDYSMNAYIWEDRAIGKVKRFHDAYRMTAADLGVVVQDKSYANMIKVTLNYADYFKELQHGGLISNTAFGEIEYKGTNKNAYIDYRKQVHPRLNLRSTMAIADETILYIDSTANRYSWSGKVVGQSRRGEFSGLSDTKRVQKGLINRSTAAIQLGKGWRLVVSNMFARQSLTGRNEFLSEDRDILINEQVLLKNISGVELSKSMLGDKLTVSAAFKNYFFRQDAVDFRSFTPIQQEETTNGYYSSFKYELHSSTFLRGSFEQAWRIPNYEQFFGNGLNIVANPNLKPESSYNINLGIFTEHRLSDNVRLKLESNLFDRSQKDIIFLTPTIRSQYTNAEEVNSRGIEIEVGSTLFEKLQIAANMTLLRKIYTKIDDNNISSQFLEGTDFPNTPTKFGNLIIYYTLDGLLKAGHQLKLGSQYKYVDEFNFINVGQIRNDENWVPVQHRLNFNATYTIDTKYSISFQLNNVSNKELFDNFKIPRPGRSFNLKFSLLHF